MERYEHGLTFAWLFFVGVFRLFDFQLQVVQEVLLTLDYFVFKNDEDPKRNV